MKAAINRRYCHLRWSIVNTLITFLSWVSLLSTICHSFTTRGNILHTHSTAGGQIFSFNWNVIVIKAIALFVEKPFSWMEESHDKNLNLTLILLLQTVAHHLTRWTYLRKLSPVVKVNQHQNHHHHHYHFRRYRVHVVVWPGLAGTASVQTKVKSLYREKIQKKEIERFGD